VARICLQKSAIFLNSLANSTSAKRTRTTRRRLFSPAATPARSSHWPASLRRHCYALVGEARATLSPTDCGSRVAGAAKEPASETETDGADVTISQLSSLGVLASSPAQGLLSLSLSLFKLEAQISARRQLAPSH